ncbi:Proline-rich receptor-like protein kinase PERK8 [Capsicum chinense]|nr:Proline-rich receptor-like protein kinase PERK8 [Capsicum chinense]
MLNHWCTKQSRSPHGTGPWTHLAQVWNHFVPNILFKVGNGSTIKSCHNNWVGNNLLNEFPLLFQIARNPDSTVAENRLGNAWNLHLEENFKTEIESFMEPLSRLENCSLKPQMRDSIAWNNSIDKVYSFKSGYTRIICRNMIIESWPWKLIWKTKLPHKARPLLGRALQKEDYDLLADPCLEKNYDGSEIFRMIEAAASCVRHSSAKRPTMGQIMRAFDGMAMHDLSNGMKVGESEIHSAALQSSEISWFRKMAFGNQDFSSDFFSQGNENGRESGEHA